MNPIWALHTTGRSEMYPSYTQINGNDILLQKKKKNWHNPWPHLENVWWLCGTKFFGVLWAEMPLIVSFGKAQIIAYSCVSSPIHLSERIPTSSGLASEEGVIDVGSSADSVPWAAPSWFLTTWPG